MTIWAAITAFLCCALGVFWLDWFAAIGWGTAAFTFLYIWEVYDE